MINILDFDQKLNKKITQLLSKPQWEYSAEVLQLYTLLHALHKVSTKQQEAYKELVLSLIQKGTYDPQAPCLAKNPVFQAKGFVVQKWVDVLNAQLQKKNPHQARRLLLKMDRT